MEEVQLNPFLPLPHPNPAPPLTSPTRRRQSVANDRHRSRMYTEKLARPGDVDESRWWGNGNTGANLAKPLTAWKPLDSNGPVSPKWNHFNGQLPSPATADHASSFFHSLLRLFSSGGSSVTTARRSSVTSTDRSGAPSQLFTAATIKFVVLCALWYTSSALSSNTGKQIMNQFKYPVTLTFVQFGFVSGYCLLFANPWYGATRLRTPTVAIMRSTLPMAVFQVGGHIFSSMAISRVPVSTVHTIKALSPLFTVVAYALLFGVRYSARTYLSLLPLTSGVMLACSFDLNLNNALGLICAFGSAVVFVTSNIFFKKVMPSPPASGSNSAPSTTPSHKLDKLNLLFYSSGLAFLLMIPLWIWSDLFRLLDHDHHPPAHTGAPPTHGVLYYFFLNGTVHWAQNIIAFAILSVTSPVTYSIASLIKRIAVILIAIAWFAQKVHPIQGFGICLTFVGLWMYNNAKADVEKGEHKMRRVEARTALALPMTKGEARAMAVTPLGSPDPNQDEWSRAGMPSYSVSSAIQQQQSVPNSAFSQTSPTHQRKQSLVPAHLLVPPSNVKSTPLAPTFPPPRIDTTAAYHAPSKPPHRHERPMSPTESYPSPPASEYSPPQSAIPDLTLNAATSSSLFNRRPTIYESSSMPIPQPVGEQTSSSIEGLGVNMSAVPIPAS